MNNCSWIGVFNDDDKILAQKGFTVTGKLKLNISRVYKILFVLLHSVIYILQSRIS